MDGTTYANDECTTTWCISMRFVRVRARRQKKANVASRSHENEQQEEREKVQQMWGKEKEGRRHGGEI